MNRLCCLASALSLAILAGGAVRAADDPEKPKDKGKGRHNPEMIFKKLDTIPTYLLWRGTALLLNAHMVQLSSLRTYSPSQLWHKQRQSHVG